MSPGPGPARPLLAVIGGLSAALLSFSVFYVRGDLGGVMTFLRERAALRRLREGGAPAEQVAQAQAGLVALAERVADPDLATRLLPLELLIGVGAGLLIWHLFGRRTQQAGARGDIQERMVRRFAYRRGGRFTLQELATGSPLEGEQARAVTARMLERGELQREGEGFRLVP